MEYLNLIASLSVLIPLKKVLIDGHVVDIEVKCFWRTTEIVYLPNSYHKNHRIKLVLFRLKWKLLCRRQQDYIRRYIKV